MENITREKVLKNILSIPNDNLLAQLPTSMGKSKIALEWINNKLKDYPFTSYNILIVVPMLVLQQNWLTEIGKWGFENLLPHIKFSTYLSLPKNLKDNVKWDIICYDEAHHLSDRCLEAFNNYPYKNIINCILLSATISRLKLIELKSTFNNLYNYNIELKDAIVSKVLPNPKLILIPLKLNNKVQTEIVINKKRGTQYKTTQLRKYNDITGLIEWYKKKNMSTRMLRASLDRLIWCSEIKEKYTKQILSLLKNRRTLTFCSTINQTKTLGKYCINSTNNKAADYIQLFNEKKIKHITACQMVNEGINLVDCQIGIFNMLNSSNLLQIQKMGRLLRHPNPIIILPYYEGTVEERNVQNMLNNYSKDLVKTIDFKELSLYNILN